MTGTELVELEFPRNEYDNSPMSLYWYARTARDMPLLQYLGYYQAIEFYFPIYSRAQATKVVRQILKDPGFRVERDSDIGRVLTSLNITGRGFGDERSQLRATIQECVEPEALRKFLSETSERIQFFTVEAKSLTDIVIPIAKSSAELRNDVADRIYDIRCKIVHAKTGNRQGEFEVILPFSSEEQMLYHDIDLIQYVARQVLIAGSTPLKL